MKKLQKMVRFHPFFPVFLGVVLLWLALPPVNCWPLGFLAPVLWCLMIFERRRPRHLYRWLYLCGCLFWLYEVHFVRYPHAVNNFLLVLLAAYMGVYLPLFVGVSRNLVHGRLPRFFTAVLGARDGVRLYSRVFGTLLAAPLVYIACDLLRGWIFTGYLMGSLCHALYRVPVLIQSADIMGEVGVSGLMVLLAAAGGVAVYAKNIRAAVTFVLTLTCMFGYGAWRMTGAGTSALEKSEYVPAVNVALVQGNIPAVLALDPETTKKTEEQYFSLTTEAVPLARGTGRPASLAGFPPSLIVWPESMYRHPVVFAQQDAVCPPGLTDENGDAFTQARFAARVHELAEGTQMRLRGISDHYNIPLVTGGSADVFTAGGVENYNAAFYVRPGDKNVAFYAKMHLVPFGEYVPFLRTLEKWMPGTAQWSPIGAGGAAGTHPGSFMVKGLASGEWFCATPSICFESVVGRLIRRQIATLEKEGVRTDFLLNVTNNGWFQNSHESRLHLACGVFRAVENRKKMLIAANYGISAEIAPTGEIFQELKHGEPGVLVATVSQNDVNAYKSSLYTRGGHLLTTVPLAIFAMGVLPKRRKNSIRQENSSRQRSGTQ